MNFFFQLNTEYILKYVSKQTADGRLPKNTVEVKMTEYSFSGKQSF